MRAGSTHALRMSGRWLRPVLAGTGYVIAYVVLDWVSYVPAYRSPALTGTGLCFAAWRTLG